MCCLPLIISPRVSLNGGFTTRAMVCFAALGGGAGSFVGGGGGAC